MHQLTQWSKSSTADQNKEQNNSCSPSVLHRIVSLASECRQSMETLLREDWVVWKSPCPRHLFHKAWLLWKYSLCMPSDSDSRPSLFPRHRVCSLVAFSADDKIFSSSQLRKSHFMFSLKIVQTWTICTIQTIWATEISSKQNVGTLIKKNYSQNPPTKREKTLMKLPKQLRSNACRLWNSYLSQS